MSYAATTERSALHGVIDCIDSVVCVPSHPGEMLLEEFLKPLEISQSAFASQTGVSFPRLYEVINAQQSVTPDTTLRLAEVTGMSASFWLGVRRDRDLWPALRSTHFSS